MRAIHGVVLLSLSLPATAEWEETAHTADADWHIDVSTVRRVGDLRNVWLIREPRYGEISRRYFHQYDCSEQKLRVLSFSVHAKQMGAGRTLFKNDEPREWRYISSNRDSVAARIFKIVCSK